VSRATEEARKEVEWITAALTPSPTFLVLLDALMAILVVDLSLLLVAEDLVCFGDFYELLVRGLVSTVSMSDMVKSGINMSTHGMGLLDVRVLIWVVFLAKILVCLLDLSVGGILLEPK
jgi:hypothetical protein